MLTTSTILVVLLAIAGYSLLSRKIEASILTLPMIFAGFGLLLGALDLDLVSADDRDGVIHIIAEITLILVLFSDASRVRYRSLLHHSAIPLRMLLIAMPLTILSGTVVAHWVSPGETWAFAFLVAAILTPTDAALAQSVVSNKNVPGPISQSINVESGLNDGFALPVVLVAAIMTADANGTPSAGAPDNIVIFALLQIVIGPVAGLIIGFAAARLLDLAAAQNWATEVAQGLYFLSVAFFAYFAAEQLGGNGFISVFAAGLVFGNTLKSPSQFIYEFMEGEGQLLTVFTFLVFGAVLAPIGLEHASFKTLALALLFLTVVRVIPVWVSLTGTGLKAKEKLFLGWFGPRGLASVLFALLVLEGFEVPAADELVACVVFTVFISIFLHGFTATPLSNAFGRGDDEMNV